MMEVSSGNDTASGTKVTSMELKDKQETGKKRSMLQTSTSAAVTGKWVNPATDNVFYFIEGSPVSPSTLKLLQERNEARRVSSDSSQNLDLAKIIPAVVVSVVVFFSLLCCCCWWFFAVAARRKCRYPQSDECRRMVGRNCHCTVCGGETYMTLHPKSEETKENPEVRIAV
jgi:hypothetical protein